MPEQTLANVRIVLVEPAGPFNVGSVARVMKNMGLQHLVLVNPQCDPLSPEARQMAVHAASILESAQQVATLPEALEGCYRVIATTARVRSLAIVPEPPRLALPWLLEMPSALIFGREDRGLNNIELNYAQRYVCIPANPDYSSLNLAQSVAICCYELFQALTPSSDRVQVRSPTIPENSNSVANVAPFEDLEGYFQHLEQLLLHIGYLHPHTAASRMEKFRQVYKRACPSITEVALLRGVLSQVNWALQHPDYFESKIHLDDPEGF
jgi:tRNA/rRNA methyltransferase